MSGPRRIRAKRARARQRERQGHDLRPHYRQSDLPASADKAVIDIEDAYSPAGRIDKFGNLVIKLSLGR